MIRGVRDNKKNNNQKLQRSRSKSPVNNKQIDKNIKNKQIAKSNKKLNRSRSKSPQRSPNGKNKAGKQNLQKSKSQKKLNKSLSRSKIQAVKANKNVSRLQKSNQKSQSIGKVASIGNSKNESILMKSARKNGQQQTPKNINKSIMIKNNSSIMNSKSPKQLKQQKQVVGSSTIKSEQKQMGLIFIKPQHDKIIFKTLQATDQVFQKYHDMISNDNDTNYVTNALPQLISMKKEDDSAGRDFVSGKIARLSGVFDNLTLDKVVTASRKVPQYYSGQSGKNLQSIKIVLHTKFKVEVDLGFLLYSVDGDKLTIFRIYVSKIYRKMNYIGFIYLQVFRMLVGKHSGCDRWSMFIMQRNVLIHKFFKYLGFKIEKIATQTKNKTVDYFQEFTMKKKQLNTVLASMK